MVRATEAEVRKERELNVEKEEGAEEVEFEEEWERLVSVKGGDWVLRVVTVVVELEFLRWGGIYDIVF